jgi:hypothetical protein
VGSSKSDFGAFINQFSYKPKPCGSGFRLCPKTRGFFRIVGFGGPEGRQTIARDERSESLEKGRMVRAPEGMRVKLRNGTTKIAGV